MNYYDENAQEFFDGTVDADMSQHHEEFLKLIPENGTILDAGCGSGRDTLKFKSLGYNVKAIDGSEEMCKLASEYSGVDVKHMQFQDINFIDEIDGIWASASLLHVPSEEIEYVLDKLKNSLRKTGILYASFKYGDFEGERNGRFFNDLTEDTAIDLFEKTGFEVIKTWLTNDSRPERKDRWTNILVRKI
ncbi:class I SAM-dependent methyltransferase [Methanobrevibacter sp.]|uniref:class I SAM-dependent methyltransferase n=1 Tax=Methanobrevibacter sp. TaxID=66852 RepID=UPI003868C972